MARSTRQAQLLAQATRMLPTLAKVRHALEKDFEGNVERALSVADEGFRPPPQENLESPALAEENVMSLEAVAPTANSVRQRRWQLFESGLSALNKVQKDGTQAHLKEDEEFGLEAVILLSGRPAICFKRGRFLPPPHPWEVLETARAKIQAAARSVGRIELKGDPVAPWIGTGFLVAADMVITNRHVAEKFCEKNGKNWKFTIGRSAGIDFTEAPVDGRPAAFALTDIVVIYPEKEPDLALFRIKPNGKARKIPPPLPITSAQPNSLARRQVYAVGYPARDPDPNHDAAAMREIFGDIYNVKRLQPGEIIKFVKSEAVVQHDSSTLGGNSGSVLLDLATHHVLGLHFGGIYRKYNKALALWTLRTDPRIKKAGLNFI